MGNHPHWAFMYEGSGDPNSGTYVCRCSDWRAVSWAPHLNFQCSFLSFFFFFEFCSKYYLLLFSDCSLKLGVMICFCCLFVCMFCFCFFPHNSRSQSRLESRVKLNTNATLCKAEQGSFPTSWPVQILWRLQKSEQDAARSQGLIL